MKAIAGVDDLPLTDNLRLGIGFWGGAVDVAPDVASAFEDATSPLKQFWRTKAVDLSAFSFGALRRQGLLISEVEGAEAHRQMLAVAPDRFSSEFRAMLEWGARQTAVRIAEARAAIASAASQFADLFNDLDVLVLPTAPQSPFAFDDATPANQADFTAIANFAGVPAVAAPATINGAPPASIQFLARRGQDGLALAIAADFERRRGVAPAPPGWD
jgi:aspartyl-tRNA(Asn)/glutamyl-tRNA(Gln) amidotransferase subunit A